MEQFTYQIGLEEDDERLDKWMSNALTDLSRSYIQKCIKDNEVYVNGQPQKASYRLKVDDEIVFRIPEAVEPAIEAEDIPLSILYEDKDLLIIDKPKGMVVHPAPGHYSGTLVNAVMYHCRDRLSSINGVIRPGIVHRIDKDTSGLLMIAKNNRAHESLSRQLAEHAITRKYTALVYNNFSEDEGTVDAPLGRDPKNRLRRAVVRENSKRAVTHWRVLERFGKYTLIEAQLETGRTHQIRVHMAYINHPLVGDMLYGPKKQPLFQEGQLLHAGVLGFVHPSTGEYMEFCRPLPDEFQQVLEKLRRS